MRLTVMSFNKDLEHKCLKKQTIKTQKVSYFTFHVYLNIRHFPFYSITISFRLSFHFQYLGYIYRRHSPFYFFNNFILVLLHFPYLFSYKHILRSVP